MNFYLKHFNVFFALATVGALYSAYDMRMENKILDRIIHKSLPEASISEDDKAIRLMNTTHELMASRLKYTSGAFSSPVEKAIPKIYSPATRHLLDAPGSCGSFTHVLIRLLERVGITSRAAQMRCGEDRGCHTVLEAKIEGRWIVLDPLYNLSFRDKNGELMNFEQVGQRWGDLKKTTPEGYNPQYRYEGVRYTNWEKIPFVSPGLYRVLKFFIGDKVDEISLRVYLLNSARNYFILFTGLLTIMSSIKIYSLKRR